MSVAKRLLPHAAGSAARAVAVDALPVTFPVSGPLNVPVVVPGSVGDDGIERVIAPVDAEAVI